jgi:hypothetical protein
VPTALTPDDQAVKTVANLPWVYVDGTDGAVKTAHEYIQTLIERGGFEWISEGKAVGTWTNKLGWTLAEGRKEIPNARQLLTLGDALGVDYVITGRAKWHTKSVWISLGPKTKADCTVDLLIVDVKKKEVSLDAKGVKMDSTAKEDPLKALGDVFISIGFTVVSGGPKTPHQQRAVQLAIAKAIEPWLATHIKKDVKLEPAKPGK